MWALCEHPCAVPLHPHGEAAVKPRTQLLSPSNPSCSAQGHPQKPAAAPTLSSGNLCPQAKGLLKGFCWVATQVQHGLRVTGFHPGSHGGFEGGQEKLSPSVAAMEILALRGVRAFRVRDRPGLRLETPTKHEEQSPVSQLASRTAGGRDTYPTHSPDKVHLPISEKNEMGLAGRVCLQRCKCWR